MSRFYNLGDMFKTEQFESYIENFAVNHGLFLPQNKYLLSISGGPDSMALFYLFLRKKIQFEVIHFNHGTRPNENLCEENLVKTICDSHNIKFHLHQLNLSFSNGNFEYIARKSRKNILNQYIANGYTIVFGHHLDDSFEWTLIQNFRQSQLKESLGIPLKGPNFIRPLMCVSKIQLLNYLKAINGSYLFDSSNLNAKYLRNDLRINLIPQIQSKFPNYLKHYVVKQNQLAKVLKVHALIQKPTKLSVTPHKFGGLVLKSDKLSNHFDQIFESILAILPEGRSKLSKIFTQIEKAILDLENNQFKTKAHKGPIHLPSDAKLFILHNRLWIYLPEFLNLFENHLLNEIDRNSLVFSQITNDKDEYFPNLMLVKSKKHSHIKSLPILTLVQKKLKESEMHFAFKKSLDLR